MNPGALETLSTPTRSVSPLLAKSDHHPRKMMNPVRRNSRSGRENAPPADPNIQMDVQVSPSLLKKSPAQRENRAKTSHGADVVEDRSLNPSDSSVKVIVRIRPINDHKGENDQIVKKVSSDSLSVGSRTFTFDSVVGLESTQEDIFQLVGIPLVKNSLAGFNTSILSYGETGSGKTYTMWGPLSAMVEEHSFSNCQGIAPRIFHMLFSEIQKKQDNAADKQISFQCRCSFLEIYNEQIDDLLDPAQRNLQIRDDAKSGFEVENLTEEYVTTVEDVTQILVKGLSNRRVGATSMNSKSSRSHIVLTCVIESWCKGTSIKSFSSSKTSRISLVDLAGSERNKLDDAGRHCIKEGILVQKSLSNFGKLVNILAEVTCSGKPQKIPYMDSCLTHLLRESLGGNAKVTFICAISPDNRCKGGTLSTLRFAQRVKYIQNKAVINEITEDYVNDLSNQIRHLKEELIREKSYQDNSAGTTGGYFKGHNARESLNLLRVSLNRSLILPCIDNDSEEEVDVDEEDVSQLCAQLSNLHSAFEKHSNDMSENKKGMHFSFEENSETNKDNDSSFLEESKLEDMHISTASTELPNGASRGSIENLLVCPDLSKLEREDQMQGSSGTLSLSIIPCRQSLVLNEPTLSVSPKISSNIKKSMRASSNLSAGENHAPESPKFNSEKISLQKSEPIRSSLQSSKLSPTDSLAASLHRGLQIIDYHQQGLASKKSLLAFSFEHLISKPCQAVDKVDAGMQTLSDEGPSLSNASAPFLCASCKQMEINNSNMQIVPLDQAETPEGLNNCFPKNDGETLAEAINRKIELEKICAEQATTINRLNCLVEQYKHELENSSNTEQNQHTKIERLEGSIDEEMPIKELQNEETSLEDEHKISNKNDQIHHEVLDAKVNPKELRKELGHEYKREKSSFDMSEREALLEEIQSLRNQLQSYLNVSANGSLLQLIRNGHVNSSADKRGEDYEKERQRWTESESRWISLTEELRIDLESNRRLAEKKDNELALEKKCTAELDDALQRAILGHTRFIEHYAELQDKHNNLLERHRKVMEGVAQVKKAAAKAGAKGAGSAFAEALAAELSALRVERERERTYLKEQNKGLRIQLRDTAEAVHAAGGLLVRLREAEEAVLVGEEKYERAKEETDKVRKQMEKLKKKHAMEIVTMKHYLAESRLPDSALEPLFRRDSDRAEDTRAAVPDDDQSWRAAFVPSYQ